MTWANEWNPTPKHFWNETNLANIEHRSSVAFARLTIDERIHLGNFSTTSNPVFNQRIVVNNLELPKKHRISQSRILLIDFISKFLVRDAEREGWGNWLMTDDFVHAHPIHSNTRHTHRRTHARLRSVCARYLGHCVRAFAALTHRAFYSINVCSTKSIQYPLRNICQFAFGRQCANRALTEGINLCKWFG